MTAYKQTKQICWLDGKFTVYFLSVSCLLKQKKINNSKASVPNAAPPIQLPVKISSRTDSSAGGCFV